MSTKIQKKDLLLYKNELVDFLRSEVKKAKMNGLIVGISGGIDSAVCALLAKEAFPHNHLVVEMPCHSDKFDLECSQKLINMHKLNTTRVDLTSTFDHLKSNIGTCVTKDFSFNNIKPRLRMTTLYALANEHNYMVVGTDNACEWFTGYFTKYGDGGVDIAPIIHLYKSEVYELGKIINVPNEIIDRTPTAGLWPNQTDEKEMGFTYQELEMYMKNHLVDLSPSTIKKIEALHQKSEHKRRGIIFPEFSTSIHANNDNLTKNSR